MTTRSETSPIRTTEVFRRNARNGFLIVVTLIGFIVGIEITVSALTTAGEGPITSLISATSNPFAAFFIGVVATAIVQSSSMITAIVVALVATGALQLPGAAAIVMGANIGTTITANIVSLGFSGDKKEVARAVAASSSHFLFNFYTVLILFPLELYNGILLRTAQKLSEYFVTAVVDTQSVDRPSGWSIIDPITNFLHAGGFGVPLLVGLLLVFVSIVAFRRIISGLLEVKSPEAFSRFFFRSPLKSFLWGAATTAAIRSSSITTSVVVAIVGKKIASLKQATPFIFGANLGTTITAFFAVLAGPANEAALSVALVHFLFNLVGVLLFLPALPPQRALLISSKYIGRICSERRFAVLAFILAVYFFIPFLIIYLAQ